MITTKDEYFANLDILQNVNQPAYALLPAAKYIYDIDVTSRTINTAQLVSIEKDHKSETIYFSIDRFVDYMDLSHTCCIIQYNANGKTHFYPVPFYDIYTKAKDNKIVFPWCLDYNVTRQSGQVEFNVRFFKVGTRITEENAAELILTYNLNTLPGYLTIKKGISELQLSKENEKYLQPSELDILMDYVDRRMQTLSRKIYWTVASDDFAGPTIDVSSKLQEDLLDVLKEEEKLH